MAYQLKPAAAREIARAIRRPRSLGSGTRRYLGGLGNQVAQLDSNGNAILPPGWRTAGAVGSTVYVQPTPGGNWQDTAADYQAALAAMRSTVAAASADPSKAVIGNQVYSFPLGIQFRRGDSYQAGFTWVANQTELAGAQARVSGADSITYYSGMNQGPHWPDISDPSAGSFQPGPETQERMATTPPSSASSSAGAGGVLSSTVSLFGLSIPVWAALALAGGAWWYFEGRK